MVVTVSTHTPSGPVTTVETESVSTRTMIEPESEWMNTESRNSGSSLESHGDLVRSRYNEIVY